MDISCVDTIEKQKLIFDVLKDVRDYYRDDFDKGLDETSKTIDLILQEYEKQRNFTRQDFDGGIEKASSSIDSVLNQIQSFILDKYDFILIVNLQCRLERMDPAWKEGSLVPFFQACIVNVITIFNMLT